MLVSVLALALALALLVFALVAARVVPVVLDAGCWALGLASTPRSSNWARSSSLVGFMFLGGIVWGCGGEGGICSPDDGEVSGVSGVVVENWW